MEHTFALEMSSPLSLKGDPPSPQQAQNHHDYNFSGAVYDEVVEDVSTTDEESPSQYSQQIFMPSRQSSVSSFPASVIHHTPISARSITPTRSPFSHLRATTPNYSPRPHSTGFRHPSSVRALQMRDEFDSTDCEDLTPNHRRRNSKLSYVSYRTGSSHSSPTKSMRGSRSAQSSPTKVKAKQEYPLVLLHCTLLPPALMARARHLSPEAGDKESVLEAIIPEPYAKRWQTLQEKVIKNIEVRTRGVLIPHPRDEYELLEERFLESLELERPRIREGHYLARDAPDASTDSGFESAGADTDSETPCPDPTTKSDETHAGKCADCGNNLSSGVEQARKWEIKVFAANGLMKAGAWNAAWSEMEKVDVEVGVWMPETVRREVDARLEALIAREQEEQSKKEKKRRGMDEERAREVYGASHNVLPASSRNQAEIDGLMDTGSVPMGPSSQAVRLETAPSQKEHEQSQHQHQQRAIPRQHVPSPEIPLSVAVAKYAGLLAQDPRNIAIVLLSALLLYYGFSINANQAVPVAGVAEVWTAVSSQPMLVETRLNAPASYTANHAAAAHSSVAVEISISVAQPSVATSTESVKPVPSTDSFETTREDAATNIDVDTVSDLLEMEIMTRPAGEAIVNDQAISEHVLCELNSRLQSGKNYCSSHRCPVFMNGLKEATEDEQDRAILSGAMADIALEEF